MSVYQVPFIAFVQYASVLEISCLMCCRELRKILRPFFLARVRYPNSKLLSLSPEQRALVRHVFMDSFDLVQISEMKLTSLTLPERFNGKMPKQVFPATLRELTFGNYFDQLLYYGDLPPNLTKLTFGDDFNQPLPHLVLPATLLSLSFGKSFDWNIRVPRNLTSLKFGANFDSLMQLDDLPPSLTCLQFGDSFKQPIFPAVLPPSLQVLIFGAAFDEPLATKTLPASLTYLNLGRAFNHALLELPPNLTVLVLSRAFTWALPELPNGLTELKFGSLYMRDLSPSQFPRSLKALQLSHLFRQPVAPGFLPPDLVSSLRGSLLAPALSGMFPRLAHSDSLRRVLQSALVAGRAARTLADSKLRGSLRLPPRVRGVAPDIESA